MTASHLYWDAANASFGKIKRRHEFHKFTLMFEPKNNNFTNLNY